MSDQIPPLSVAQARDEILMMADGDPQYWAALLDALIAAVRAEGAAQIEQLQTNYQTTLIALGEAEADGSDFRRRAEAAEAKLVEAGHRSLEQGERLIEWRNRAERAEAENQRLRAQAQP